MPASSQPHDPTPSGPQAPASGRAFAVVLFGGAALALLAGGALLWRERAELVFLDMVASALAMCF